MFLWRGISQHSKEEEEEPRDSASLIRDLNHCKRFVSKLHGEINYINARLGLNQIH